MELISAYLNKIHKNLNDNIVIENILRGINNDVKIKNVSHGLIILSNNKIIKCCQNYYKSINQKKSLKHENIAKQCLDTRKAFDLNCSEFQCVQCHLECIRKKSLNELILQ